MAWAARQLVGSPFRLHGRDPERGLDCVGVVAAAMAAIGRPVQVPHGYRLRLLEIEPFLPLAGRAGLGETSGPIEPGDILLLESGPAQFHLAIVASEGGIVHAHAGLHRVVHTPFPLPWPIVRRWHIVNA